jgi:hypothetical protein
MRRAGIGHHAHRLATLLEQHEELLALEGRHPNVRSAVQNEQGRRNDSTAKPNSAQALRLVAWSCIAFHASSGVLELYAYTRGTNVLVLGNVAARIIIVALFAYLSRRGPR